jgi:hypothetical protein
MGRWIAYTQHVIDMPVYCFIFFFYLDLCYSHPPTELIEFRLRNHSIKHGNVKEEEKKKFIDII